MDINSPVGLTQKTPVAPKTGSTQKTPVSPNVTTISKTPTAPKITLQQRTPIGITLGATNKTPAAPRTSADDRSKTWSASLVHNQASSTGASAGNRVSDEDARKIAQETVGKGPVTRSPIIAKKGGTGLSPRERQQVSIKQPVQKTTTAAGPKTPGTIAMESQAKKSDTRAATFKKLATPPKVITKPSTSATTGTVSKQKNVLTYTKGSSEITRNAPTGTTSGKGVDMSKLGKGSAKDVKNIVQRRTANIKAGKSNTIKTAPDNPDTLRKPQGTIESRIKSGSEKVRPKLVSISKGEAKEAVTSANQQYKESQRSSYVLPKVANPMHEPGVQAHVDKLAAQGIKESNAQEKLRSKQLKISKRK